MKRFVYADNAATTKLDIDAFDAMKPYLLDEYSNPSQPYSFARSAKKALKDARMTIAECIGAKPEEIYFTSGGTESDNWAIKGIIFDNPQKQAIITSQIEHHAVLNSCSVVEKLGCPVTYLPVDNCGTVLPKTLEDFITDKTKLVSIMFSNNEIGTVEPIEELSKIAHNHGAIFHTDAVQALGHIEINVNNIGVDMLSASAHKFNGPKGVGFLYIKEGTLVAPYNVGGAQEFGMRAGTENVASVVGMAVALKKNCDNLSKQKEHIKVLEATLLNELSKLKLDYIRNGYNQIPGNLCLSFNNKNGESILHSLDLQGIAISTGAACDNVTTQVSHVLRAIGLPDQYAKGTIRISLGRENSIGDVYAIVNALQKAVK